MPGAGCRVRLLRGILAAIAVAAVACSGPTSTDAPGGAMPPQPDASTVASKVNLDEIFPPGEGRDLVLNNCQNCHTFVPIVVLQMEEAAWTRNSIDHRERVTQLSDEHFKTLYTYLRANFHPGRPVPTLPKELLDTWTSY
jgi:mono/diheme cytochrome c family protein